ncbi:MAG: type II secretion system protein [Bdellovibrionaceae bacterium]|nr:type II secretion system protein [Pseudobdellovibrionaceae bacterium]
MKNQRGLTMIEVAIAMGISAVVLAVAMTSLFQLTKNQNDLSNKVAATVDALLGENSIFVDLRNIEPSFNNVTTLSDEGLAFFDFYPDVPEAMVKAKKRTITLSLSGTTEFVFLQTDLGAGPMLVYDPVLAYDVGPPPNDPRTAASLSYSSLNKNGAVINQQPGLWSQGKTLLLDTPVRIRPTVNGGIDLMTPPRSPIFVGRVSGNNLLSDTAINERLNTTHPGTGVLIQSPDLFLRTIPSMGGGSSYVRIRPVRIVRYYLEKQPDSKYPNAAILKKTVYADGAYSAPFVIMDQIKTIQFQRETVTQKVMTFSIEKAGQ